MSNFLDTFDAVLAEQFATDPDFPAAYAAAQARTAALLERPCSEGNCVELYDPKTDEVSAGWGPVGCACQDGVR